MDWEHTHYLHVDGQLENRDQLVRFTGKQARSMPVAGLRISLFGGGGMHAQSHVARWMMILQRAPVEWLQPSEDKWRINLDGAKEALLSNLNWTCGHDFEWPTWLRDSIQQAPSFVTPDPSRGAPHLRFFLTEGAVAASRYPLISGHEERSTIIFGDVNMGSDTFNIKDSQVATAGRGSISHNASFVKGAPTASSPVDLGKLTEELQLLLEEMRAAARGPEQFAAATSIASAEEAAAKGDGNATLMHLKSAGVWALDVATKIGVGVALKAIEHAMKTP